MHVRFHAEAQDTARRFLNDIKGYCVTITPKNGDGEQYDALIVGTTTGDNGLMLQVQPCDDPTEPTGDVQTIDPYDVKEILIN